MYDDPLLTPEEVATYFKIIPHTLAEWRCKKNHPLKFIRIGRLVRYRRSDVLKFMQEQSSDFSIESL